MIWKDPVCAKTDLEAWLHLGDFPPGLTKHAIQNQAKRKLFPPRYVEGGLLLIKERKDVDANIKVLSGLLASAKDHVDAATFFQGYRAPYLIKDFNPRTDEDGVSELDEIITVDLLVVAALDGMTPDEAELLDRTLARRALGPAKLTVVVVPGDWDKYLVKTIKAHEERVVRL